MNSRPLLRTLPTITIPLAALALLACASDTQPAPATGGAMPTAGAVASGGSPVTGGATIQSGGTTVITGGVSSGGNTVATGGVQTGGLNSATGGISTGGSTLPAGGTTIATGGVRTGGTVVPGNCGSATLTLNPHPFGCKFAWGGAEDQLGSLTNTNHLQFASTWVDSGISASGKFTTCNACNWITGKVAPTNLIPVYYAYIIGFLAHSNGIVDGNQTGGKKLTTDGGALVKANRQAIVDAYGWYAKESFKVWPSKPLIWLLEGDFVQLVDAGQSQPLTYAELSSLVVDITCAIKSNMPNAVVAIDHSAWNSNDVSTKFWDAMKPANYDLVWTTGVGNNQGFLNADGNASKYNATTAKYSWLNSYTGKSTQVEANCRCLVLVSEPN